MLCLKRLLNFIKNKIGTVLKECKEVWTVVDGHYLPGHYPPRT